MVTAITTTDVHDAAFNCYARIIAKKRHIEEVGHSIGEDLFEFQHCHQWRAMGFTSFNAFLSDPNISIVKRTAQRLIRVHKHYIIGILLPQVAAIENKYWPELPPPVAQQEIDEMEREFKEDMGKAGTTKLDIAVRFIDGRSVKSLMNSAMTQTKEDFTAHLTGIEPVYHAFNWRECLREARSRCLELMQSDAPDEVKSFAADFWSATGSH